MKTIKGIIAVTLVTVVQFANATNELAQSIDANSTREAVGMDAIILVPILVLLVLLVVLGFATQKIPGLEG